MKTEHLTMVLIAIIILLIISAFYSPESEEVEIVEEPKFVVVEEKQESEAIIEEVKEEPKEAIIKIKSGFFEPEEVTIEPGTTVIWVNDDDLPHKVADRETPRYFYGEKIFPGESYSFTFNEIDEFSYYDVIFPATMRGKIIVKEEGIPITGKVIAVPNYKNRATGALILTAIVLLLSVYLVFYYERKHYL